MEPSFPHEFPSLACRETQQDVLRAKATLASHGAPLAKGRQKRHSMGYDNYVANRTAQSRPASKPVVGFTRFDEHLGGGATRITAQTEQAPQSVHAAGKLGLTDNLPEQFHRAVALVCERGLSPLDADAKFSALLTPKQPAIC